MNDERATNFTISIAETSADLTQIEFYFSQSIAWCRDHGPAFYLLNAKAEQQKLWCWLGL